MFRDWVVEKQSIGGSDEIGDPGSAGIWPPGLEPFDWIGDAGSVLGWPRVP